jgi:hypothetical protein
MWPRRASLPKGKRALAAHLGALDRLVATARARD